MSELVRSYLFHGPDFIRIGLILAARPRNGDNTQDKSVYEAVDGLIQAQKLA